ncbi:MAG: metallophosphoesterase [Candidatus Thorarchaeota archaeon]|nr:MAG: metallophosphoesterase [Candidatus Thorarchaeota archaeon]
MEFIFDDRGLVIAESERTTLVIADLHLGFHVQLSEKSGASFPSQHTSMLDRIRLLVEHHSVDSLYIIGDVKHTISVDRPFNWSIIPSFLTDVSSLVSTVIVPGNHDGDLTPLLPRSIEVTGVHGVIIGYGEESVGLVHGHAWPSEKVLSSRVLVIGHSHPSLLRLKVVHAPGVDRPNRKRYGGTVPVVLRSRFSRDCVCGHIGTKSSDVDAGQLVTLPSFNQIISGIPINKQAVELPGVFFQSDCVSFQNSDVISTDGVHLGTVDALQERYTEKTTQRND